MSEEGLRIALLALAPLALMTGCGSDPTPAVVAGRSSEAPSSTTAAAMTPAVAPTAAPPLQDSARKLALDGEGLRLVDPQSGSTSLIAFGSPREAVERAVVTALGQPGYRGRNEECPAGPTDILAYGDLTLDFHRGRFVAWTLSDRPGASPPLTTMDGITLGTTRAEVERSRALTLIEDSTLEGEFAFGDGSISGAGGGFLSGTGTQARITGLFAGANCFFR